MTKQEMREELIEDAEYLDDLQIGTTTKKGRLLIIQARAHTVLAIMALGEWPVEENERPTLPV
jgi:hypothetical protein